MSLFHHEKVWGHVIQRALDLGLIYMSAVWDYINTSIKT